MNKLIAWIIQEHLCFTKNTIILNAITVIKRSLNTDEIGKQLKAVSEAVAH